MTQRGSLRSFAALVALSILFGACSNSPEKDTLIEKATGTGQVKSRQIALPDQLLGLSVNQERVTQDVLKVNRPYVDSVGIFAMREKDLLRATLQVSHLNSVARPRSDAFRRSIINLMGTSTPLELRIGDTKVFNTSGNKQALFVWFEGRGFYVLSVHQDYPFPRTLLREVVKIDKGL